MDAQQSKAAFNKAGQHFQNQQYNEALQILNQLNKANPGNKDILYPMSQCMVKTDRLESAQKICDFLIEKFDHAGAKKVAGEIQAANDPMAGLDVGGLGIDNLSGDLGDLSGGLDMDIGGSSKPKTAPPPLPLQRATALDEAKPIILWVGILIAGLAQYLYLLNGFDGQAMLDTWEQAEEFSMDLVSPLMPLILSGMLFSYIYWVFVSYFSLKIFSHLPNDDFMDDMKDAALYTFFCYLLCFVPIVGWIAIPIVIKKHYELEIGQLALVIMVWIGMAFAVNMAIGFILPNPFDGIDFTAPTN